jgi:nitric oxide reductase NorD protein
MNAPLSAAELGKRLDYLLGPVLSSRRTATPLAQALAALDRRQQDFVLHWVEVIDRSNYELAYQFAAAAPAALDHLGAASAEAWVIHAMDAYDREGLFRGSERKAMPQPSSNTPRRLNCSSAVSPDGG